MKHQYYWDRQGKWAQQFDKCITCGDNKYGHLAKGVCHKCYYKEYKQSDKYLKYARDYEKKKRIEVLTHYSDGDMKCACCGEQAFEFLGLDHINGGGNKHRKEIKTTRLYDYLKKNNYPEGFQVLCHNCNMAKGFRGICPHQIN